jgi:hypothetical protein
MSTNSNNQISNLFQAYLQRSQQKNLEPLRAVVRTVENQELTFTST